RSSASSSSLLYSLIFLLMRPPPSSTLFPYTTLFRSQDDRPTSSFREAAAAYQRAAESYGRTGTAYGDVKAVTAGDRGFAGTPLEDRKSTRLNSSHRTISYAVFCLKKKKNTKNTRSNT